MKKLLTYLLFLIPVIGFGQTTLNVNQIKPNFSTGGVWKKMGTIIVPTIGAMQNSVQEPTVIYEGTPRILSNVTGSIYKMWFSGGYGSPNIYYAESYDGMHYTVPVLVYAGHARSCVVHVGATYYLYASLGTTGTQIDVASSSTGLAFTTTTSALITRIGSGSVANSSVYFDGTTYQMLLDYTTTAGGVFQIGYWSSTSPTSGFTASGSNPVISNGGVSVGAPYLTKIGSTWYCWALATPSGTDLLPSDIYRWSSANLTSWTKNTTSPALQRTTADEGVNTTGAGGGQVADPTLFFDGTKVGMAYAADSSGSVAAGSHIKMAWYSGTFAQLVQTLEGDGGNIPQAQPSSLDSAVSNGRFIRNSTTYFTEDISMQNAFAGLHMRYTSPATTIGNYLPDEVVWTKSGGVSNYVQGGAGGLVLNATSSGGITFQNNSIGALGTADNTGAWTSVNGYTATAGNINVSSGNFAVNKTALGTTKVRGLYLADPTVATVGTTVQNSPQIEWLGTAYNSSTTLSTYQAMNMYFKPITGATPGGQLTLGYGNNLAAYSDVYSWNVNGIFTTPALTISTTPTTSGGAFHYLTINDGTGVVEETAGGGGGSGTVTSVAASGANGIGVSGSPITTSGTLALSLGRITPTTINTTIIPATIYQTAAGTAGTDSVMVKHSGGIVDAISPTYYGATGSPLSQFASTTSAQLLGVISDETGSGSLVFGTSPTLTTPTLGVATATSINKVAITAPTTSATLTLVDGSTLATSGAFSTTFVATNTTLATLPSGTVTLVATGNTTTLTNKTLGSGTVITAATMTLGSDATGDIYYRAAGGALTRLAIGTSGQVLASSGTLPTWATSTAPSIRASADLTAQTAAGNITTFTVGAATATFDISAYVNVTAVATDVIQIQVTYTDENNTAQTVSMSTVSTVTNSTYSPVTIRAKNATVITVKTNLTVGAGSITFDAGARITGY